MTRAERLDAIRKRAEKAATREWAMDEEPSRFELEAIEDIPWLLSELERMERELDQCDCPRDPISAGPVGALRRRTGYKP